MLDDAGQRKRMYRQRSPLIQLTLLVLNIWRLFVGLQSEMNLQ